MPARTSFTARPFVMACLTPTSKASMAFLQPFSAFRACGLVQRGTQTSGEFDGVVVGPEMHEEKPRLFGQHMAMYRGDLDPVRAQRADHWIDLIAGQNK